jgi:IclR family transcriptional regulator, acetate operon repressor
VSTPRTEPAGRQTGAPAVTAVLRTADVLSYLAQAPTRTVGVTEVAQALGLSKAVVFRILVSLQDRGYVEVDEPTRRYLLGPKSLALGMSYLERTDIRETARGALTQLSAETGETATLSVRSGWERMYVDQVTPAGDIKMVVPIGRPFPLHAGSSSKAFLAFLPGEERDRYLSERPLVALTDATITARSALLADLEQIRTRGYAASCGERQPGAGSVAAPVLDREGLPVAVVSVCGPIERFRARFDEAARLLVAETQRLSRRLGYRH